MCFSTECLLGFVEFVGLNIGYLPSADVFGDYTPEASQEAVGALDTGVGPLQDLL